MKEVIFNEMYLEYYWKWGRGYYFSNSKGVLEIKNMNSKHIENAIAQLTKQREQRFSRVINTMSGGDVIVDRIKAIYASGGDLIQLKIDELASELALRSM